MFETLTEKLNIALGKITSRGSLSEKDVTSVLREIRLALLEADVDYTVVRSLTQKVKEKATGERVFGSLSPGQTVVKIVHEEITSILGEKDAPIAQPNNPPVQIMLIGLQGAGKTTTAAKLAHFVKRKGHSVMLAACDLQRPAAIDQLAQLAKDVQTPVYANKNARSPRHAARDAFKQAKKTGVDYLILDTAGRNTVDEALMRELADMKKRIKPEEALLILDAMTGQTAVQLGREFDSKVGITGLILSKTDGDARGGAALSMRATVNAPIKFVTAGEKPHQIEEYRPGRLASRILGMGDIDTLVERAQEAADKKARNKTDKRLTKGKFDMEDYLEQIHSLKKIGSFGEIMSMIPGMNKLVPRAGTEEQNQKKMTWTEAIILSMTRVERAHPEVIKGSRRKRIADGSGTSVAQVNQVLQQHRQIQKMFKRLKGKNASRSMAGLFR